MNIVIAEIRSFFSLVFLRCAVNSRCKMADLVMETVEVMRSLPLCSLDKGNISNI